MIIKQVSKCHLVHDLIEIDLKFLSFKIIFISGILYMCLQIFLEISKIRTKNFKTMAIHKLRNFQISCFLFSESSVSFFYMAKVFKQFHI